MQESSALQIGSARCVGPPSSVRTHVRDQQAAETRTTYDLVDNVTQVLDAAWNATVFEHDSHNRVTREQNAADLVTRAGATARTFTYDASNNRTAATDRESREQRFGYDLLNRVTTETWHPSPGSATTSRTFTFVYDAQNNLIGATDYNNTGSAVNSSHTATYDLLSRKTSETDNAASAVASITTDSAFNAASERTSLTVTKGGTVNYANTYTNDTLSRMTKVVQTGSGVAVKRVELAYNKLDQFSEILRRSADTDTGNLVVDTDYTYESGTTRLGVLKHTAGETRTYTFTHDPGDRITQILSYDGSNNYTHNKRNELLTASLDSESYDYDGAGNRSGHTIDPNNEIVSDGTNTYSYDKEGNRKTKIGAGLTATYTWDHRNRLTKVESTVSSTTTTVDYKYDLFDRRIERAVSGGATQRFGYDGDSIVLQTDGADAVTHRYLQGPVIDQVFADERVTGGNLGNHWLLTDHLGTVRDLATNTGSMGLHIPFNSFGVRGTPQGSGPETLYSFTGREHDVETGLYYYRARYYDPAVGTFISVDPIGFDAGDSNLYRYVNNRPTIASDPSGLQPPPERWQNDKHKEWEETQKLVKEHGLKQAIYLKVNEKFWLSPEERQKEMEALYRFHNLELPAGKPQPPAGPQIIPTLVLYDAADEGTSKGKNWFHKIFTSDGSDLARAAQRYPNVVIEPDDFGRTVKRLEQFCSKNNSRIQNLCIYDHGSPGGNQEIGNIMLSEILSTPAGKKQLERLGACIAEGGRLSLYGCNVGNDKEQLEQVWKRMPHIESIRASTQNVLFYPGWMEGSIFRSPNGDMDVRVPAKK